ncbi:hypothetical protein AALP_AA6G134400 [Arabis alpina]|uniref:TIR domain-containing protein n=1 Tax=Arabis alpina TaxID=50452 RepID=A0A087GP00_ARAAL|nr:hypothetical protein AALP_AA6G134400 [Arabis alpina]
MLNERINVFVDEMELRSRELNHIFNRIEESRVAVTIFSEKYTESTWCLDELAKMKERVDQGKLQVIPIFFNVKTCDVKLLRGNFGDNFRSLRDIHGRDVSNKFGEGNH